jgi:hypothetical protein
MSVLHTWGSALTHHPHVHMVVPGGGLSPDGSKWIACRPRYFLTVEVLSALHEGGEDAGGGGQAEADAEGYGGDAMDRFFNLVDLVNQLEQEKAAGRSGRLSEKLSDAFMVVHRGPIISLAARNNVPAVYATRDFIADGGLLSYGASHLDVFRRAAPYLVHANHPLKSFPAQRRCSVCRA